MKGPATCDDAVLAFLRAELDSPTEGERLRRALDRLSVDARLIEHANAGDTAENETRWTVFQAYRGHERLFEGLNLRELVWQRAALDERDLRERVVTCRHGYEERYGTRDPGLVAGAIEAQRPVPANGVAERLRRGERLEPPLLLAAEAEAPRMVILEGHNRLIACLRDPAAVDFPIPVLVGIGPDVARWHQW